MCARFASRENSGDIGEGIEGTSVASSKVKKSEKEREEERKRGRMRVYMCERKRERESSGKRRVFEREISRDSIVTPLIVICAYKASEIKEI